jgi:predicted DCC family thiol-disulfide oxidoreductase YuxK
MNSKALKDAVRDHYLRIDARSLGLFRVAMGTVLLADLACRFRYAKAFYSNDGVLANHANLFNLRETGHVWSILHAFSSPGEAQTALCFMGFFYACFLVGWHTRVFQVVALACLVSLGSRDVLLENAGNYLAVALLGFTVFLPLGSRFSLDSLRASMSARDEKGAAALNDRRDPDPVAIAVARGPGWTPTSIAATAVLVQVAIVFLCMALQQKGPTWTDGTALYYALNVERWVSAVGASMRGLPPGLLSVWTRALRVAELAIPVLVLFPLAPRYARGTAVALVVFVGLTLGVPFSFGLFAWTLLASAALLVPRATWDRAEGHAAPRRAATVIYDVDCGMCLWISRLLVRLDLRHDLTFQGNDDLGGLSVREGGALVRRDLPKDVTPELVATSVVVVDAKGLVHTRARAVAAVIEALPLGWLVAWLLRLPGVVQLVGLKYDFIATRRQRISVAMGLAACGITPPAEESAVAAEPARQALRAAPTTRIARGVTGLVREGSAFVVLAAALSQTTQVNDLPWNKLPQPKWLASVAAWPRMLARWDVLAAPPTDDEVFVVDAQTKGGKSVDPFTGKEPVLVPGHMRGTGLGQLWDDYLWRVHQREWIEYQRSFRDYLAKGGPHWAGEGDDAITGFDAYFIKQPIPPPGQPRDDKQFSRDKFMSQGRGGKLGVVPTPALPLVRPTLPKP